MPAKDPEDQQAARDFEQRLRYAVFSGRTPQSQLDWFLGLPKRVRRSRRLIGEALGPQAEMRERTREQRERQMAQRVGNLLHSAAHTSPGPPPPRDLSCLKRDGRAWQGIGRRKRRCRVFHAIGTAFSLHRQLSASVPQTAPNGQPATPVPAPVLLVSAETTPNARPATPEGLREAVCDMRTLQAVANGLASNGMNSPESLVPSQLSEPVACLPPAYPDSPDSSDLFVNGSRIDRDFAFIVASGRHSVAPWQGYSIREAAVDIEVNEQLAPGSLGLLAALLCPGGVSHFEEMLMPSEVLLDFCRGWYALVSQM